MSNGGFITIVAAEEKTEQTRSGRTTEVSRVTDKVSVDELRRKFGEFMDSLETAFSVQDLKTETGLFQLQEITFSAEMSATGDFKLLGTGVGVSAGSALSFVLRRKEER